MVFKFYRIVAPHFVAGLAVEKDTNKVVKAAPILNWTINKSWFYVESYANKKGWILF